MRQLRDLARGRVLLAIVAACLSSCRLVLDVDGVAFVDGAAGNAGTEAASGAGPGGGAGAAAAGGGGGAGTSGAGASGAGTSGAGTSGAGTSGAGTSGAGAAGAGAGSTGGAGAGAGGTGAGAGGEAGGGAGAGASPTFPLAGTVIRLESDQKLLTDGVDRVHGWLDLGDYAPAANIGLHAPENAAPRYYDSKLGDRSVLFSFEAKNEVLRFSYGSQLDDWSKGLTLSFVVRFGALLSYQALFDCGSAEDTADLTSLNGRIFIGSDGLSDNLAYYVFGVNGQGLTHVAAEAVVNDPDLFKLVTIRHSPTGLVTISVGSEVLGSGFGPTPVSVPRTRCNLGKSLLANKPDNEHFDGAVRAMYAFKRPLVDEELQALDAYVFTRFARK